MKPKILLICDEKGWGGWERGEYMIKHLSDEFDFTLLDGREFNEWEGKSWKNIKRYDLYYPLFHTMLMKKSITRLLMQGAPIVTMVTVYPILRKIFASPGASNVKNFLFRAYKCKAIFCNNIKSLTDLNKIYGGPSFYVPRGVDTNVFYPESTEFRRHNRLHVVFVGKKNPEKGLETIIEPACKEADVKLITNQRNFTNALSKDDMRRFYNMADVYIVASTMDGTPNTALEAAACGKPILTNKIGNMPQFIKNGVNGFLINRKIHTYVNRLKWFKENRENAWKMGIEARKTIENGWTWEHGMGYERHALRSVLNG
jgi:glycosyltransferase involved in cell wall biosynthesis